MRSDSSDDRRNRRDRRDFLFEALTETVELYRQQAKRLVGLASSSALPEARVEFLELAQRYEALAEHAAERAYGVFPDWRKSRRGADAASRSAASAVRHRA